MTTALVERKTDAPAVTSDQLDLVKRTIAQGATDAELRLYLYDCQRQGVHPLDRLLHFTKRGGKYTPVTSIDLMRIRAAETGEYAGSDDAEFEEPTNSPFPNHARVTVWRLVQGMRCAFTATARWDEYYPGDGPAGTMWRKMPHTMLAKCAEALALRKGFPRQLAGLYAREEMDQAENSGGMVVEAPAQSTTVTSANIPPTVDGIPPFHSETEKLPAGTFLIQRVEDSKFGKGRITLHRSRTGEPGEDASFLIYKSELRTLAEELCQTGTPVFVEFKESAAHKWRIEGLHRVPADYDGSEEPRDVCEDDIDAGDIPF